jgi:hypothetical protein
LLGAGALGQARSAVGRCLWDLALAAAIRKLVFTTDPLVVKMLLRGEGVSHFKWWELMGLF